MPGEQFSNELVSELRRAAAKILERVVAGEELSVEMFGEITQFHCFMIGCRNVKHNDLRLKEDGLEMPDMTTNDYELSVMRRALAKLPQLVS